jgi:3-deoxy-7-phosphoheptulonate synthase
MLVVMSQGCSPDCGERVISALAAAGRRAERIALADRAAVRADGPFDVALAEVVGRLPGVALVLPASRPMRHVLRREGRGATTVRLGRHTIGDGGFTIVAGPCAVEDEAGLERVARAVAEAGADVLRGGAFKPRASPYDFQGLGRPALPLLARVGAAVGLPVVTEALDAASLDEVSRHAHMVQIGARNMDNSALLKHAGRAGIPVLLKRGMAATLEDLLLAAEYVLEEGNPHVVLCERGIRTFSDHSRYTLDLGIVPVLKRVSHLPVIVDPSHASGAREVVPALARAALAAGADGVMVEVHPDPLHALSDGRQSLTPEEFRVLASDLRALEPLLARHREPVT